MLQPLQLAVLGLCSISTPCASDKFEVLDGTTDIKQSSKQT